MHRATFPCPISLDGELVLNDILLASKWVSTCQNQYPGVLTPTLGTGHWDAAMSDTKPTPEWALDLKCVVPRFLFCLTNCTTCPCKAGMSFKKGEKERGNVRLLFGARQSAFAVSWHRHSNPNTQATSLCEFARKMAPLFTSEISKSASDSHSEKRHKHSTQEQSKIHQMLFFFNWEGRLTSFHWTHVCTDQCQLLFVWYF